MAMANCAVCDKVIESGELSHVLCINIEILDTKDEVTSIYNVQDSIEYLHTCEHHANAISTCVHTLRLKIPLLVDIKSSNVTALRSDYSCERCGKDIHDGESIVFLVSSKETEESDSVTVLEAHNVLVVCLACKDATSLEKTLTEVVTKSVTLAR